MPNMNIIRFDAAKLKFLNSRRSIMGFRYRSCRTTRPMRLTAAITESVRMKREPDIVQTNARAPHSSDIRRILYQAQDQKRRQDPNRQINVEDPPPRVVKGNPPTQDRANRRRQHGRNSVQREGHAALLRRKRVGQNRLGHRLKSATTRSLEGAEHDQHPEAWGGTAQHRTECEEQDTEDKETLAAEADRQPSADRQDN